MVLGELTEKGFKVQEMGLWETLVNDLKAQGKTPEKHKLETVNVNKAVLHDNMGFHGGENQKQDILPNGGHVKEEVASKHDYNTNMKTEQKHYQQSKILKSMKHDRPPDTLGYEKGVDMVQQMQKQDNRQSNIGNMDREKEIDRVRYHAQQDLGRAKFNGWITEKVHAQQDRRRAKSNGWKADNGDVVHKESQNDGQNVEKQDMKGEDNLAKPQIFKSRKLNGFLPWERQGIFDTLQKVSYISAYHISPA